MESNVQTYSANHIIDFYCDKYNFSVGYDCYFFLSYIIKIAINQYEIRYSGNPHIGRFKTIKYILKRDTNSLNPKLDNFLNEFFLKLSNRMKRDYSDVLTSELLYKHMNSFCPRWPFC